MNKRDISESMKWMHEFECPDGYQFKDDNGNVINATKIVLEKIKKEYPKTYKECLAILNYNIGRVSGYKASLLAKLQDLLVCRDAYWKIAGEELGLGKSWKPDWADNNAKYSIYTIKGALTKAISCYDGAILAFPTVEMQDAFYENFKDLIEQCKELL